MYLGAIPPNKLLVVFRKTGNLVPTFIFITGIDCTSKNVFKEDCGC